MPASSNRILIAFLSCFFSITIIYYTYLINKHYALHGTYLDRAKEKGK